MNLEADMGDVAELVAEQTRRVQVDYMVFVGSPLAAPTRAGFEDNLRYAESLCHMVATKAGVVPYAPHLIFPRFLDDGIEEERWLGIGGGIVTLKRCNEVVLRLPEHLSALTRGMAAEKEKAIEFKIPFTVIHNDEAWRRYLVDLRNRALGAAQIRIG